MEQALWDDNPFLLTLNDVDGPFHSVSPAPAVLYTQGKDAFVKAARPLPFCRSMLLDSVYVRFNLPEASTLLSALIAHVGAAESLDRLIRKMPSWAPFSLWSCHN
jgi:hypothetical protein